MAALDVPEPDFMADEELVMLRDSAATFFRRAAPPERVERWREAGQVERDFWREVGQAGFLGVSVPTEYGGAGGDFRHDVVLVEQAARARLEGFALSLHNVIITPYIQRHGTEEQKRRWLPKLCSGERVSAIAMSEPGAGSDLQAIRTTAIKDGNGYRINGAKTFISNGQIADLIVVVAKTDPAQGARGISLLVVETDEVEGFRRGKALDKIGNEAQDTSELFFDDVWVPSENLLGLEEGRGFYQLMDELPKERLIIAISGVITMERAIEETVEYTRNRKAFGQPVFDFQNTQFKLAECKAKATIAKVFVQDCMRRVLDGTLDNPTSAIAKMWVTDTECQIVDDCLQLHGGYGYINDYPIARMYKNSRIQRIYGGSNEIMKVLIARSL
ncbi:MULTISPECIES: acyl-CoA dehydrogenase family protein [unclassified Sphingomonas]|jgi:alkylation response protein AidB-like acyl-CoA dehydrogenase|uniref:acyl-CoA dehydrogenase family protein n=1 Tax=unclassified Sphingomonas TaxID=196159 RepID=UPI00082F0737|nr:MULTISPECIES: acyl-CoA dehydrogenase family protein [unclassified Sphingomonas]